MSAFIRCGNCRVLSSNGLEHVVGCPSYVGLNRQIPDPPAPRTLTFTVIGIPAPQGSKTNYGKGRTVESSKAVKPWREAVKWAALHELETHCIWAPFDGPLVLDVTFWLPRPKSAPKKRWAPDGRPDCSKLVRSTEDALTEAGVWADDARVTDIRALKRYAVGRPGAYITVTEATP